MRILWLKTELLHPVDKGGKIRTYHTLKGLKSDHQITYLTLDDGTADGETRDLASEYCHDLICVPHRTREKFTAGFYFELLSNLVSNLPYAIRKYESVEMRRQIVTQSSKGGFDIVVCDFLAPAINVPTNLTCATALFQHNVEAMIWKRHYEVQTNPLKKAYLYRQWQKMDAFEGAMCRRFDSIVAVSAEDRDIIKRSYRVENVYDIPTGVDVDFFRPAGTVAPKPNNLVFTGSMDWLPNGDAIRYFTDEIMPLIKREIPNMTLTVVGRNPDSRLIELARHDSSIKVTGRVDDVRPYIEGAAAYIVPLRIGGGTRLKIFEAMAMEKPIVSTTIGAEGLPIQHERDLLIADSPVSFAQAVARLFSDKDFASSLGQRAATWVRQNFGWEKAAEEFETICERAIEIRQSKSRSSLALAKEQPA